jgi:hypothetical protein
MLRLPAHAVYKVLIAAGVGCLSAIYLRVYLLYRLGLEAYESGKELPTSTATLGASIPFCIALAYCGWVLLRYSPVIQGALRAWLRDGWLLRFDKRKRLLSVLERAVQGGEAWEHRRATTNETMLRHPAWVWGGKPALVGMLAVFAASPLLLVSPIVADVLDANISLAGVILLAAIVWAAATVAYLAARWTGYLDQHDRTPKRRASQIEKRSRISEQFGARIGEAPELSVTERFVTFYRKHRKTSSPEKTSPRFSCIARHCEQRWEPFSISKKASCCALL